MVSVPGGFGGAINSQGNLTPENCSLVNNHCLGGTETRHTLSASFGSLIMSNTTVSGNVCGNVIGVYVQDQPVTLIGCTFSGNSGSGGDALLSECVTPSVPN